MNITILKEDENNVSSKRRRTSTTATNTAMLSHAKPNYFFLAFLVTMKSISPSVSFSQQYTSQTFTRKFNPIPRRRRRRQYPILTSAATRYTIDDEVCPPVDEGQLKRIVQKHCKYLDSFLENKPIAEHTLSAFRQILPHIDVTKKIILDSGCGTGRSTLLLGEKYPSHAVIGVDRSFVRLNKNNLDTKHENDFGAAAADSSDDCRRPFRAVSSNVLLVRAELTDFWRCCLNEKLEVDEHYILYPNPYPKKNRIKKRFYAHPSFPIILILGGSKIVVRSNWEGYLREFARSVRYADELYASEGMENFALPYSEDATAGPKERTDKSVAWTNFEKKYDVVGERTHELMLRKR